MSDPMIYYRYHYGTFYQARKKVNPTQTALWLTIAAIYDLTQEFFCQNNHTDEELMDARFIQLTCENFLTQNNTSSTRLETIIKEYLEKLSHTYEKEKKSSPLKYLLRTAKEMLKHRMLEDERALKHRMLEDERELSENNISMRELLIQHIRKHQKLKSVTAKKPIIYSSFSDSDDEEGGWDLHHSLMKQLIARRKRLSDEGPEEEYADCDMDKTSKPFSL